MKIGDVVRLKSMSICEQIDDNCVHDVGIYALGMKEYFGTEVTVANVREHWFGIEEDEDRHIWNNLWVDEIVSSKTETVTFVIDEAYSAPTKMYLKATGLAIDVMERIRVENPTFWEVLKTSGTRDNFFREILEDKFKVWEFAEFDWANNGFNAFFTWSESLAGSRYWIDVHETYGTKPAPPKNKASNYHFVDDKIDLDQICSDTIKDGKSTFMVDGVEQTYVGWLKGSESAKLVTPPVKKITGRHSLTVCEIAQSDKSEWGEFLQELATTYSEKDKKRDEFIKDRDRVKNGLRFNVTTW